MIHYIYCLELLYMSQRKKWNIPKGDTIVPKEMLDSGMSPLLSALMFARGYETAAQAVAFLSGADEKMGEDSLWDIDKAVSRIRRAVAEKERVAIFGDYDVDGITSTCLITDFLNGKLGLDCVSYIPDRISEGYGLNCDAIARLADDGVTLIITVDCGITATKEAEFARTLGVDMIITDHHECQENLPQAVAVIDPKRNPQGAGHALAGVGVAFKLVCAIDGDADKMLDEYADLVAIGTVADVMPLVGENRMMVRAGLQKIAKSPRAGIRALLEESGADTSRMSATTIGFTLAPRLNAAGRLGVVHKAAELIVEKDEKRATALAAELCELNRSRQELELDIWTQAQEKLRDYPKNVPIVLAEEDWHQGVVGIVASRIAETYSQPTVMICLDGDKGKGSCRSCSGFNLFEALSACSAHLTSFGGHALAAGLCIDRAQVDAFRAALAQYYTENPPQASAATFDLRIDDPEMLSLNDVRSLDLLEPCGTGNPRARLCMLDARLESVTPMGGGRHLRLSILKGRKRLECVYFSHSESDLRVHAGDRVELAFYPQINEYRSRTTVQLVLSDIRKYDPLPLCSRVLERKLPEYGEGEAVCPERQDFAELWRSIHGMGGELSGSLKSILKTLSCTRLHPGKICACMAVFEETGLLNLEKNDDIYTVTQMETAEKKDLNDSRYLRSLSGPERS